MTTTLDKLFAKHEGVAGSRQILGVISRRTMQSHIREGKLVKIWPGIYSLGAPDLNTRLRGLDLRCGEPVVPCLGTAADVYGFDTEGTTKLHVLNPTKTLLRGDRNLVVHRRLGAPLQTVKGRNLTAPNWTAVEVARTLRRPRALATLDAALRSTTCEAEELLRAAEQQVGRRGIIVVRELIPLASPKAESPMESESRLVMIDGEIPAPELQYELIDREGKLWRLDFAWPEHKLAMEYDGFEWHSSHAQLIHDRQKVAALNDLGWRVFNIVSADVRGNPGPLLRRLRRALAA